MGPVAITLMLAVALAAFAVFAARKLTILRHLAREPRLDHPWRRLRSVLENGFLQSRMIRREWKPGVMHAVIFAGFLTLLVRKLHLFAMGYDASLTLPGTLGGLFAAAKDGIEIAVLAACGYALYRRLVQKPARLTPNREALLVLGLIVAIMLTDLAFDAFRFARFSEADPALAHERARLLESTT